MARTAALLMLFLAVGVFAITVNGKARIVEEMDDASDSMAMPSMDFNSPPDDLDSESNGFQIPGTPWTLPPCLCFADIFSGGKCLVNTCLAGKCFTSPGNNTNQGSFRFLGYEVLYYCECQKGSYWSPEEKNCIYCPKYPYEMYDDALGKCVMVADPSSAPPSGL
eukprot:TRINITY_DN632_c0_g1_i5.p1 TRINITY_DN632_c0_g1~~TRINITY_DN632_c0_g1_i5.p1  ORF type:complete len:165 (+),score=14.29 TRINITY_DN632_c0_g1_i5:266-760(+)